MSYILSPPDPKEQVMLINTLSWILIPNCLLYRHLSFILNKHVYTLYNTKQKYVCFRSHAEKYLGRSVGNYFFYFFFFTELMLDGV